MEVGSKVRSDRRVGGPRDGWQEQGQEVQMRHMGVCEGEGSHGRQRPDTSPRRGTEFPGPYGS